MQKTLATILLVALALSGLAPAAAAQTDTVTVHLTVETQAGEAAGFSPAETSDLPGTGQCDVTVPSGADGGTVLDRATAIGCISGWDHTTFGDDRFVTEVDDVEAPGFTCLLFAVGVCDYWAMLLDGQATPYGIDGYAAEDGDALEFEYRNTF